MSDQVENQNVGFLTMGVRNVAKTGQLWLEMHIRGSPVPDGFQVAGRAERAGGLVGDRIH